MCTCSKVCFQMMKRLYFCKSLQFDENKMIAKNCFIVFVAVDKKSSLDILNTDVSKFTLISKNIVWTHFIFLF